MSIFNKTVATIAAAMGLSFVPLTPIWADDTDIFFGDVGASNVRPNVTFIIDTSGSMSGMVDGTGKDRLDNVKDAFRTLLTELNDVNVGIMRFSNPGGPVLYPVSYIDGDVNANSLVDVSAFIGADDDDAQQAAVSEVTEVFESRLELINMVIGATESFNLQLDESSDDTEERISTGGQIVGGSQLDFLRSYDQRIGVRFENLNVPVGATIVNAYVRFTGRNAGNADPLQVKVSAEADETGAFDGGFNNVNNRVRTGASVDWNIVQTVAAEQTIDTPNLKDVLQEVVEHPQWVAGNEDDLVLIFEPPVGAVGNGERDFYAWDSSAARSPQLYVEYYVGPPPETELSLVGLRFSNVNVPRGVKVKTAYISFTAEQDSDGPFKYVVHGEKTPDPQPYEEINKNISDRMTTAASVAWEGDGPARGGESYGTPNLAAIVEEIAADNDWCGGNNMAFVISGTEGLRTAWSHDGDPTRAPSLFVQYEYDSIVPGASCQVKTISRTIGASSDDVEDSGAALTTGNVFDFESGNLVGLRFRNLGIPKDTKISSAYIEITADSFDSGDTKIEIEHEASDDAQTYSAGDSVADRVHEHKHDWNIVDNWVAGNSYQSPDLTHHVERVVSRDGWKSGNSMAFQLKTTTTTNRRGKTWDRSPGEAPRLVVEFLDDGTATENQLVRDQLLTIVDGLNHSGYTPIQDTLLEAARYYTGGEVLWGKQRGGPNDSGPHAYTRVSSGKAMVGGSYKIVRPVGCTDDNLGANACRGETIQGFAGEPKYDSPIDDACQYNSHIILLTDGFANRPHSDAMIENFIGGACANEPTVDPATGNITALRVGETCVKDLVKYLNEVDQAPGADFPDSQTVTTHTIGFNFSSQWLEDVATAGGGVYKTASTADQLAAEIKAIIGDVLKTDSTFVAPVAAVNQFNRLNHLSEIYFAVFRPDEYPQWPGNVKKYKLSADNNDILDQNDKPAINPDTGFFDEKALSVWTNAAAVPGGADGGIVDAGGAASKLPGYLDRNIYTYYSGSASKTLSNPANLLVTANADLTKAMFNAAGMNDAEFANHIQWIRGADVVTDGAGNEAIVGDRYSFGDPLHSRPVAITYGGTEINPDVEIFVGSNAGAIHAINATIGNGVETFAFFPEATLPMQIDLRNNKATDPHPYGMDGTLTPWVNNNGDAAIKAAEGDYVWLFSGMRRGGSNYYGLDVTDRDNPKIKWVIEGGKVAANGDDFSELGQTWSRMVPGQVQLDGEADPRKVLFFTGGYDEDQDDAKVQTADDRGRAIYIVDADTGELVWSGGKKGAGVWNEEFEAMDYSIPSSLSVGDVNGDGLADAMFVADVGGQLWRFDIVNGNTPNNLITGGVIAELGDTNGLGDADDITDNRRFFHQPSVALIRGANGPELAVTVGTGFRPSPLAELAANRAFMIRQTPAFSAPDYAAVKVTVADLYNATENLLDSFDEDQQEELAAEIEKLEAAAGWYFDLPFNAEKVLSSPLITDNTVVFTTYQPGAAQVSCKAAAGTSRVYQVSLLDATPVNNWDLLDADTKNDRYKVLKTATIVDEPTIICTGAGCTTFIGTEDPLKDLLPSDRVTKTFWREDF